MTRKTANQITQQAKDHICPEQLKVVFQAIHRALMGWNFMFIISPAIIDYLQQDPFLYKISNAIGPYVFIDWRDPQ